MTGTLTGGDGGALGQGCLCSPGKKQRIKGFVSLSLLGLSSSIISRPVMSSQAHWHFHHPPKLNGGAAEDLSKWA